MSLGLKHGVAEARQQELVGSLLAQVKPDGLKLRRVEFRNKKFRDEQYASQAFPKQGLRMSYVEETNERGVCERFVKIVKTTPNTRTAVEILEVQTPGLVGKTETRIRFFESVLVERTMHISDIKMRRLDETKTYDDSYWTRSGPGETNTPQALETAQRLVARVTQARQQ